MGMFIPSRRSQPRRFDYEPRFYNPEKDESIKRRMRVKGQARQRRRSKAELLYFLVMLGLAVFIYMQVTS